MYRNVQGALEPDLGIDLLVNGAPFDASDITASVMLWEKPDGTTVQIDLVADAAAGGLALGKLRRVWEPGDTDMVGDHAGVVVVTRGNGEEQVFPSDGRRLHWKISARPVVS